MSSESLPSIAARLASASHAVCFTGAGISTESGIPDFRSPGGIWSQSQPVMFDDFVSDPDSRYEYWRQKAVAHRDFASAAPNAAHQILARWEAAGRLAGVITQNIDGLHQQAGTRNILELHGTAREIACLDCRWRTAADELVERFLETDVVPECPKCRGLLKHATISFGQALDPDVIREALGWSRTADFFLVLGSSLVVHPAAGLPEAAKQSGACLVIVNREPTPLDSLADFVVHEAIGETMAALADEVDRILNGAGGQA